LDDLFARLATLVESLTDDVVFAMSRGSRELFHSDTLAWYLDRCPVVGEALLVAWQVPRTGHACEAPVRREWRNLDLVVEHPGRSPPVIENKVFSLPDTVQLNAYAAGKLHGLDHPVLVLLSLVAPGWPDGSWTTPNGLTWRYGSYEELCAGLRPCLPDLRRTDGFGADVFERWLDLIDKLVRLVAEVGSPAGAEPLLLPEEAVATFKSARLDATVQKMRCLHVSPRPGRAGAGDRTGRGHRADGDEPGPGQRGDVHRGDDPVLRPADTGRSVPAGLPDRPGSWARPRPDAAGCHYQGRPHPGVATLKRLIDRPGAPTPITG
jgi:hypothetical protein